MAKGRSDFGEDEDQLLVKYIGVYSPGIAGRLGNKLYKDLVENVDKKRSWSQYHTWQSWRERYKKKQDWFNNQILKYQKKKIAERTSYRHASNLHLTESEPKTKQPTAAEGETGDEGELRICKCKGSEVRNEQGKAHPVSGANDSTLSIDPRLYAKKSNIRPPARKDPSTTNSTNKSPPKRSRLSRQNNDDDPFGTLPPTPIRSQPAAKPKRPPVLVEGGFRTAFSKSRRIGGGSDSDSFLEFVEPKKTWPPQRKKGSIMPSKTLAKSGRGISPSRKVDKGKSRDKDSTDSVNNAKKTNLLKGTEAGVDHLTEGGVDEDDAMDVDDVQADINASVDLGQGVEGRNRSLSVQPFANGQSNDRDGKVRAEVESPECSINVAKVDIRASSGQGRSPETTNSPPQRRQPVQVNAIATSSKVTLADLPNFSLNSPPQLPYESASKDVEPLSLKPIPQQLVQSSVSPPQIAQISRAKKVTQNDQPLVSQEAELGISSTGSTMSRSRPLVFFKTLSTGLTSALVTGDSVTLVEDVEPESKASDDKIPSPKFTSTPLGNSKSKKVDLRRVAARPSLAHQQHHESSENRVPLMDLREVALRRHSGLRWSLSSHPSSHSATPPYVSRRQSRRPVSIAESLPPEELEVVLEFGLKGALEKMAAKLGFAYEPVRLIFQQAKSFNKTLARIMEVGNQAGNEMLAELDLEDEEEDDEEANQSNILDGLPLDTRHKREAKRPSLHVKPLLDDDQISEYSPPTKSRAGQFSRLVKQGREEEALSRERRRSGPLPRNSSPAVLPATPPPPHIPRPKPAAPTPDIQTLNDEEMDALFGGPLSQSTVEDSQSRIQPELDTEELRAEYKRLVLTVTAQDTGDFEEFERRLGPDLLRVWTLDLILERTEPPL